MRHWTDSVFVRMLSCIFLFLRFYISAYTTDNAKLEALDTANLRRRQSIHFAKRLGGHTHSVTAQYRLSLSDGEGNKLLAAFFL